ncbi:MAG: pyridoxal phosphate-dependent aminotransferase [Candidatus Bathyarchaeia archaeon]
MSILLKDIRKRLEGLEPTVHGGNVWEVADETTIMRCGLIDFSSNINPLGPSEKVYAAIRDNIWKVRFYPQKDSEKLRIKIAEHHGDLSYRNVIVGNGSCELIHLFSQAFIQSHTSTLIPVPTFGEYLNAALKAGGLVKEVRPKRDFTVDPEELIDSIGDSNVIFLCNPNNPTGTILERGSLLKIVEAASRRDALVFVDEGFIDFVDEPEKYTLSHDVGSYWNLFILRSLTKSHGLAGIRIGYGLGSEEIIENLHRLKIPWNVNCLAQAAAEAALDDIEYLHKVRRLIFSERKWMLSRLKSIPKLKTYDSRTNFILIDTGPSGLTGREISRRALEKGMMIRDCSSFRGLDDFHIRVAVRTRSENLRLIKFLESL